ncbi:MAG: BamA/TamA family outer membrane protein [Cyanobacteria bacterium P01_C01_bin.120]
MRQNHSLVALLTLSATLSIASQARGETVAAATSQAANSAAVGVAELVTTAENSTTEVRADTALHSGAVATLEHFATLEPDFADAEVFPAAVETESAETDSRLTAQPLESSPAFVSVHGLNQPQLAAEVAPIDTTESREIAQTDDATPAPETEAEDVEEAETDEADEADEEPGAAEIENEDETQVLVAEVAVTDAAGAPIDPELEDEVYNAIGTRPGQTTTRSQLQADINSVFATGFFAEVRALPTDTPLGVRIVFAVNPYPVLTQVQLAGSVLTDFEVEENEVEEGRDALRVGTCDVALATNITLDEVVDCIFAGQYGETANLRDLQNGILQLNNFYQNQGYVLAQVIDAPRIEDDGVAVLEVAEGEIGNINIQFMTEDGLIEDDEGNPIDGRTRDFIILREFETQPGDVFEQGQIRSDLGEVFALGIFSEVTVGLNPTEGDPRKVDVTVFVVEQNTGSVAAGAGFNFTGDLFGTLSYRQDNFGGNNQKFSAEAQLSFRDILFDVSFTDPWIGGDPNRTSYTLNGFGRRSIPLVFDGGPNEIDLANGDRVRLNRFGAGLTFRRPLGSGWTASLGTLYQRVRASDADGETATEDAAGNPLTASDSGSDDLWTVQFGVVQDRRNSALTPTSGSVLRLGTEQSIPLGSGSIFFNRLRASYSYYFPVSFLSFGEGPQAIAINVQGGSIIGDFPPYEAFSIGGTNSVRGYDEGELGSGQSYLQASVEYRFPLFSFLGGALFLDAGTDIGTGDNVPGSPGPDRDKPGSGFGYGAGVRVQTPLGPIRIDYGINDQGDGRLHFGIGERF